MKCRCVSIREKVVESFRYGVETENKYTPLYSSAASDIYKRQTNICI